MKGINKVILLGMVGQEPEVKTLDGGDKVASFSLATTKSWKKDDKWVEATEWHNVVGFKHTAEAIERGVTKGSKMYVEGEIKTRTWDKDGVKMYRTEIIASTISVTDKKEGTPSGSIAANEPGEEDDLPF